jgi:hypothetical protein
VIVGGTQNMPTIFGERLTAMPATTIYNASRFQIANCQLSARFLGF